MSAPEPAGRSNRVRRVVVIIALLGLAVATGIIGWVGFGKVAHAFATIGWKGLLALIAAYLPPVGLLAAAWWTLDPGAKVKDLFVLYYARLVRDASGELLPFSSLGGFVFGARAAILGGMEPAAAIATTAADVTAEFIGQLGFTAVGVALLAQQPAAQLENQQLLNSSVLGLAAGVVAAILFVFVQRWASGPIERGVARWAPSALAQTSAVISQLHDLYRKPGRLTISSVLHLGAWLLGAVGVWAAIHVAGLDFVVVDGKHVNLTLRTIVGLESLVYVVRTITFATPMGLGVIEGGYVVVGHLFGLPADFCLALSLIKRLRDIAIGLPALGAWQVLEGRRVLVGKGKAAALASGSDLT